MIGWLISISLRGRSLVIFLAIALIIFGTQKIKNTPMDVFPEFSPPLVEIQTEASGLSSEEVESLVTVPLENALNGTSWLETIRSKSVLGLSSIVLIFEDGVDIMKARQLVQERLAIAQTKLPKIAHQPVILSPLSSTSRALKIGMTSKILDQMDLTDLALWSIRPRLMAIPGVANVAIWGQRDRQFQVLVNPERLQIHNISLKQVITAAGDAAVVSSGGFIDSVNQRLPVNHVTALKTPDDLANTVIIIRDGLIIRIKDVADVVIGHPPPIGDAVINDGPGLLLIVEKQPWGNTLEVTQRVEKTLEAMKPGLKNVEIDSTIFRPATFIEDSIANLTKAMWISCLLVILVLILFLFDWRTAAISITAIPLSLLAALIIIQIKGGTVNTMILAGLVIAIGEVVDDAIIDVENIIRRLRLNAVLDNPLPALKVVLSASLEVRSAVVYASMIVVLVFLPVFFLDGLSGTFFRPLAMSYILAILASLLVALTVTPALSLLLLSKTSGRKSDPPLTRILKNGYHKILPFFINRPKWALAFIIVAVTSTGLATTKLGEQFLPDFKERDFLMHWVEKPGISLEAMTRITTVVSKELRAIPGVRNFGSHIGRAEVADEVVGPNFTELWISMDRSVDYDDTHNKIKEVVHGYPGLYRDVLTYLRERIKEVLTGTSASVVVRIYGDDLTELKSKAEEVRNVMEKVDGISNLKVEQQSLVPQIQIRLIADSASQFGLTPGMIRNSITNLVKGKIVGQVFDDQKIYDVVIWGEESIRSDIHALNELLIETPIGVSVPLKDVAEITINPTPNIIKRESASRRIDVSCNVIGDDLGVIARNIEKDVLQLNFKQGYHPEFLGEYAAREESRKRLLHLSLFALLGILVLLHVDFQSVRLSLLVAISLPFALIGGVVGAFIDGGILSLGSLIGFITVLGIAARNGIMLISHYKHLQEVENHPFDFQLVMQGAEERLAPILMTALTAALALTPLVLAGNVPGHEIEHPMAIVILGGLVTSTLLNLFLMPALFAWLGKRK